MSSSLPSHENKFKNVCTDIVNIIYLVLKWIGVAIIMAGFGYGTAMFIQNSGIPRDSFGIALCVFLVVLVGIAELRHALLTNPQSHNDDPMNIV